MHDGVVVTNDKHDILTKDSQLFFFAQELRDGVRDRDVTEGLDLGPVLHFNDDLEQLRVEVALEKTTLSALCEKRIVSNSSGQVLVVIGGAANKNRDLKLLLEGLSLHDCVDLVLPVVVLYT